MPVRIREFNDKLAQGRLMRISSEDRNPGETNDRFKINFNNAAYCQNLKAVIVKSVSFKHNFPNLFKVGQNDGGIPAQNTLYKMIYNGLEIEVEIPAGWYTASELASTLTNVINADPAVSGFLVELQGSPIPTLQRKFVFSSGGVSFQLLARNSGNSMGDVLGITFDTADDVSTKIANSLPDLGGLKTAYICSPELSSNQMVASSNNGENIPVLTEVPIKVGFGEQILYEPYEAAMESVVYPSTRNLNSLSIRLCARNGSALPLDQYPLTLVLKFIYYHL
jgi:hypothetical protein